MLYTIKKTREDTIKKLEDLGGMSPKQLRTLRNQLNNRLRAFEQHGTKVKELSASHALFGKNEQECKELLDQVIKFINKKGE